MMLSINSGIESIVQFLTTLFIFIFVLAITYVVTKYIAAIQKGKVRAGNMELIETLRISNNKYLQIVRVGGTFFCMAVCKDTVTLLGKIPKEELVFSDEDGNTAMNFGAVLEKMKQKQLEMKKQDTNGEKRH